MFDVDEWDQGDWYADDPAWQPQRQRPKGVKAFFVVVLFAVVATILLLAARSGSPTGSAKRFLSAAIAFDRNRAGRLTCEHPPPNSLLGQGGSMIGDWLAEIDGGAITQYIDVDQIARRINIDPVDLQYETVQREGNHAVVRVSGPLHVSAVGLSYPFQLNEHWQMVRERGGWKWCGRM